MKSKDEDRLENCSLENIKLRDHVWVVFAINAPSDIHCISGPDSYKIPEC